MFITYAFPTQVAAINDNIYKYMYFKRLIIAQTLGNSV
jgi:hypothetical protein